MARSIRHLVLLSFCATPLLLPSAATAQLVVEELLIGAMRRVEGQLPLGWVFIVEGEGSGYTRLQFRKPGSAQFQDAQIDPSGNGAFFIDGPFATFSSLTETYPEGTYRIRVNNTNQADFAWNPPALTTSDFTAPFAVNTMPVDGSTIDDSTPDYTYSTNCTNCTSVLEVCVASGITFEGCFETETTPFPTTVMTSQLRDGNDQPIVSLADGDYEIETLLARLSATPGVDLSPPLAAPLVYIEASAVSAFSTFTVPEPVGVMGGLAALAALAAVRRRVAAT